MTGLSMAWRVCLLSLWLGVLLALPQPATAEWLSKVIGLAEKAGSKAVRHGGGVLDDTLVHLKAVPVGPRGTALAADVGAEGHWTFVNRAGERFTAGTPDELGRVTSVLAPETSAQQGPLTVVLGEGAVFRNRAALKDLPKGWELRMMVGSTSYPLLRRGEGAAERLYAQVRRSVVVEVAERQPFTEAMWQLDRPLARANVRVLALEPGGPQTLSSAPKIETGTGRALVDSIDPYKLADAMRSLRGQTVIVSGRIDGRLLYFRSGSGPERSLIVDDLTAAAEAADVNLIVLQSAAPRQPGSRNWLWQRIEVDGLDAAMQRATLADFLDGLAAGQGRLTVTVREAGLGRVRLTAVPLPDESAPLSGVGSVLTELVSDVTGRVVTSAIDASLTSAERERELEQRIIPGIPSDIQFGYLGMLIIGLMGLPAALAWWRRVWPAERREEYGVAIGYHAARLVRLVVFALAFLPLVGTPALLWTLALQVWAFITLPVRAWRWLFGRRSPQPG
jgi:hypothetical protein